MKKALYNKLAISIIGCLFMVLGGLVSQGWALPFNSRPVTNANLDYTSVPNQEKSLKEVFQDIGIDTTQYDVYSNQSSAAIFSSTGSSNTAASFIIELAGNAANNEIGIYDYTSGVEATIFGGSQTAGDRANLNFWANGTLNVSIFSNGSLVSSETYSNFHDAWGLYMNTGTYTFYSEDSKNPDSAPQILAYQGDGIQTVTVPGGIPGTFGPNHWIFAFEDLPYNSSDKDFQDAVIMVESAEPVPEPATILLFGTGLIGLAGVARKKVKES